jgi:chromosome segregation ATPase
VLHSQEDPGPWYLISEAELQNIEQYKEKSEAERQNWLSQVSGLQDLANRSQNESANLNRQLSTAREAQRKSEQLYEQSEAERLTLLSLKNGEISDLKDTLAAEQLRAEKYKGQGRGWLIISIVLALVIIGSIVIRVLRFLRIIPV